MGLSMQAPDVRCPEAIQERTANKKESNQSLPDIPD